MRRAILPALAASALLLTGCDDSTSSADPTTPEETAPVTQAPTTQATDDAEETQDAAAPTDDAAGVTTGPDDAASTTAPGEREIQGGEDGQAAADVVKSFFIAMVEADPAVCDHLLSFTDPTRAMPDHPSDYETCQELLPPVLERDVAPEGDAELAGIIGAMNIYGADVDGDTAVVDEDNYSELFAQTVGSEPITLRRIDGSWYIDLDHSFQSADER